MIKLSRLLVAAAFPALFPALAAAADLAQVYRQAQDNDPQFIAARATLDAGREKAPQGLSGLLPNVTLSGATTWNDNEIKPHGGGAMSNPRFNSNSYQLTLAQPLFAEDGEFSGVLVADLNLSSMAALLDRPAAEPEARGVAVTA